MKEINTILQQGYSIDHIEKALIRLFLSKHDLQVSQNKILLNMLNDHHEDIVQIKKILEEVFQEELTISNLVTVFEILIPAEDKKNGAFYTPTNITEYMVPETITSAQQTVCDPSCGCGAFLIQAAKYFVEQFNLDIKQVIENNIYGVDLAEYSVTRCKVLLSLLALSLGRDFNFDFNIKTSDSLKSDWGELFPEIITEDIGAGFDCVIGNPPYVKFQDLPVQLREDLFKEWIVLKKGNYNLYFAFFELGVNIMNDAGRLAYICPNSYFTSLAAKPLREYLNEYKLVSRIIDFSHIKIFDAQTYTCITFIDKSEKEFIEFGKITKTEELEKIKKIKFSKIKYKTLEDSKWRLLRKQDQQNIKKIEALPNTLKNSVDIRVGVATCKDSVFFIEDAEDDDGFYSKIIGDSKYKIESAVTREINKISDFTNQEDLNNNKRRIIFPYQEKSDSLEIIPETEFSKKYPECYKYLLKNKQQLKMRDKGKKKYPEWYAYARTQGLNFNGEKLLTPTFSQQPRFLFEKEQSSLFCNGYAIYLKENSEINDLEILQKILNSSVMSYYVEQTSVSIQGGYSCYQKNFIEKFAIPELTGKDKSYLKRTKDQQKIDKFLLDKYQIKI